MTAGQQKFLTGQVCKEVAEERQRQDVKFGEQNHPDFFGANQAMRERVRDICVAQCDQATADGSLTWEHILQEECMEALACGEDLTHLRRELIQVSAVCVAWVEAIDRRRRVATA